MRDVVLCVEEPTRRQYWREETETYWIDKIRWRERITHRWREENSTGHVYVGMLETELPLERVRWVMTYWFNRIYLEWLSHNCHYSRLMGITTCTTSKSSILIIHWLKNEGKLYRTLEKIRLRRRGRSLLQFTLPPLPIFILLLKTFLFCFSQFYSHLRISYASVFNECQNDKEITESKIDVNCFDVCDRR